MRITLEVPWTSESTSFPWWVIIDPPRKRDEEESEQDYHEIAMSVVGPFFSREEAEAELAATRYNYSKRAVVYCKSGCYSRKYREEMTSRRCAELSWSYWFNQQMKEVRYAIVSAVDAVMSHVPVLRTGARRL